MVCDKKWDDRSEEEKLIGCWTAKPEELKGTGRPNRINGSMNHQLVFYADGTMDDLTYYTIAFKKTDPLIFSYVNYKIMEGVLHKEHLTNGIIESTKPLPITFSESNIFYGERIYYKSNCY